MRRGQATPSILNHEARSSQLMRTTANDAGLEFANGGHANGTPMAGRGAPKDRWQTLGPGRQRDYHKQLSGVPCCVADDTGGSWSFCDFTGIDEVAVSAGRNLFTEPEPQHTDRLLSEPVWLILATHDSNGLSIGTAHHAR